MSLVLLPAEVWYSFKATKLQADFTCDGFALCSYLVFKLIKNFRCKFGMQQHSTFSPDRISKSHSEEMQMSPVVTESRRTGWEEELEVHCE